MSKQPEQILEEQLVAHCKAWFVHLADIKTFKLLKSNRIEKLSLKMYTVFKKGFTFVQTVSALHTVRSANDWFFFESNFTNNNTPPMPLYDAHLGGFLFFIDL